MRVPHGLEPIYYVLSLVCVGVTVACALPATNYGNPSGLSATKLPGTDTLSCGGDAGDLDAASFEAGGADAGAPCSVSWSSDLYPKVVGVWSCAAASCHATGAVAPLIVAGDPSAALASLKAWQLSTRPGVPYIGTSGAPQASTIDCNLGGFCTPGMPVAPAAPLSDDDRCLLRAWLTCGAPDN